MERGVKNMENGMSAESPMAAELESLTARVRAVETHAQTSDELLEHVVETMEADAAAEAAFSTIDHNELAARLAKETGDDGAPVAAVDSAVCANMCARATAIGSAQVTKHLAAHHMPGFGGMGISKLSCFHKWVEMVRGPAAAAGALHDDAPSDSGDQSEVAEQDQGPDAEGERSDQEGEPEEGEAEEEEQEDLESARVVRRQAQMQARIDERVAEKMEQTLALHAISTQVGKVQVETEVAAWEEPKAEAVTVKVV